MWQQLFVLFLLDKSCFLGYTLPLSGAQNYHNSIQVWPELQAIALENRIPSVLLALFAVWCFVFFCHDMKMSHIMKLSF